jgi:hypothetical protein
MPPHNRRSKYRIEEETGEEFGGRSLPLSRERRARRGNRVWAGGDGAASVAAQSGGGSGARRGRRAGPWRKRKRRGEGRAKAARKGRARGRGGSLEEREGCGATVRCKVTDAAARDVLFSRFRPSAPGVFSH